ncbi:MAG: polyketide synthase [Acetivibrionales bacterium]|jgi:polyketide biosynthesis enoyl-CoA hydratase PksI
MKGTVRLNKENGVGIIAMEERESKNTFTRFLIEDLIETFGYVQRSHELKVIVICGYDNYFCCGGSKTELMEILEGKVNFIDLGIYDLLLSCKLPVIAAMQGHAIGGGLAFGSYADIIVMAEECIYSANFMRYGFTPGMGSTYILRKKFGELIGTEMLFTARNYYGRELKERGVQAIVTKKNEVVNTALEIARELATKPLLSLQLLKEHMANQIRKELEGVVSLEAEMHKKTFKLPEVLERINSLYGR